MSTSETRRRVERVEHAYSTYLPSGKGFLPPVVPDDRLPETFKPYVRACDGLPGRFGGTNSSVRPWLDGLFSRHDATVCAAIDRLSLMERQKLMTVLSMLAHAYRWEKTPPDRAAFELTHLTLPPVSTSHGRTWHACWASLESAVSGTWHFATGLWYPGQEVALTQWMR